MNFLPGIGQGNPRSVCCGVFSYQKWHWTKTVETIFGWLFWPLDFQIDLALSVMNYGIGLQWDGESDERPNFMPQDPFVPCDSNKCFFAWMESPQVLRICRRRMQKILWNINVKMHVMTNKCTDVRVSLGLESGSYCRMCYRKQLTTESIANERKKTCRTSYMGCPICKEPICNECWKEGYNKHA